MATPGNILFAPTVWDIGTIVHTCTAGMPFASIAFTIVAPQRVSVPQVDVRITPFTPLARSLSAMASPYFFALETAVVFPTVE